MATVFVSLAGGLVIGAGVHGMPISEAARKLLILSIGEGLVGQIPSMLSSVAAGDLATRVSEEGEKGGLDSDSVGVLAREKRSLGAAAAAVCAPATAPGFPTVVLLILGVSALGLSASRCGWTQSATLLA